MQQAVFKEKCILYKNETKLEPQANFAHKASFLCDILSNSYTVTLLSHKSKIFCDHYCKIIPSNDFLLLKELNSGVNGDYGLKH
jgi:hypothetical protein